MKKLKKNQEWRKSKETRWDEYDNSNYSDKIIRR